MVSMEQVAETLGFSPNEVAYYRQLFDYDRIPENLMGGLKRYIEQKVLPGSFLTAVLENNLSEAVGRADIRSLYILPIIVCWLYNEAPGSCWGSPEKVKAWVAS